MMRPVWAVLAACALATPAGAATLDVAPFSAMSEGGDIGAGWAPLAFRKIDRRTRYALVRDGDAVVVRADADG